MICEYIGDGVYVTIDLTAAIQITLTTGHHDRAHADNVIYIDARMFQLLSDIIKRAVDNARSEKMNIQPKFSIGDVVYGPSTEMSRATTECPDCLGSGTVEVHTPGGEIYPAACGMCSYGFFATGKLTREVFVPYARKLTIASIRTDTGDDPPVHYMCTETGVGSGRLWRESELFTDESSAMASATEEADRLTSEHEERERRRIEDAKRRASRKPSLERRRIHELEKELKALKATMEAKS